MIPEVSCEFMQAIMSPYYLWQSGSSGMVWRQTSQTGGVFLMSSIFPSIAHQIEHPSAFTMGRIVFLLFFFICKSKNFGTDLVSFGL